MVDIKAYYLADSAHSERRMTSGPSTQPVGASAHSQNGSKTDRSPARVETAISTKAQIFHAFSGLRSLLETLGGANSKNHDNGVGPSSSRATGDIGRTEITSAPVIRQQGASQIIVARFAQYAQPDTALLPPAGPVKLTVGITEQALTIGPGKNTLEALVQSLNGVPGLKAWLLQTREGLAVLIKSLPGTSNALQPASIETLWRLIQPALPSQIHPLVISIDEIPAADARAAVTGLARNAVDGASVDYRIAATSQSNAHLHPKETIASLQQRVAVLIREMNAIITLLANISKRGPSKGPNICLQDRMFAQALLDRLRKITSRPAYGFASDPILPADIGLEIGEDGLLVFNEACFKTMSEHRQDLATAMVGPNAYPDDMRLSPHIKETDLLKPGVYTLIYDPTHTPAIATLDGSPLLRCHDDDGRPVLLLTAQAQQLAIVLTQDAPMATDLVYRLSLFDQLAGFAATVLPPDAARLHSGTAHDFVLSSAQRDDLPADNTIVAVLTQSANHSDMAQMIEGGSIPPQAAELLFYLLWIGLFIPRADRERRKKHHPNRRPKANSSSAPTFGQPLSEQISALKDDG
jgi:flagellar hook-associated protein 2